MDDAKLPFNTRLIFTHLITQHLEHFLIWSSGPDLKKTWLYFELMICDKYRGKNTGPQCVKSLRNVHDWKMDFIKILLGKWHPCSKTLLFWSDAGLKNLALENTVSNYPIYKVIQIWLNFNFNFNLFHIP
jgi:hypothetical protein